MQRWIDWGPFFAIKQYKIEGTINSYCTFILQKLKKTNFFCYRYRTCIGCLYYFFKITNHDFCAQMQFVTSQRIVIYGDFN